MLLEAMKMELWIRAPADGRVAEVRCAVGAVVDRGDELVVMEGAGERVGPLPRLRRG